MEAGNHGTVKNADTCEMMLVQRLEASEASFLRRGFEILLIVRPSRIGVAWNVDIQHGSLGDRLHIRVSGRKRAYGIKLCLLVIDRFCCFPHHFSPGEQRLQL